MPELGPMMRALELQRLIEDKVSEWRERSARVTGATVADSYQQPLNFKRHTHRRKNSAEINRIIAKYSRPNKRAHEPYATRITSESPPTRPPRTNPVRPPRTKKLSNSKVISKSEDNLASMGDYDMHPDPATDQNKPRFNLAKYNAKSCEDVTAFVDIHHSMKSKNFDQTSIMNARTVTSDPHPPRLKLHSICEDLKVESDFNDSGLDLRKKSDFATSTPLSKRKTCPLESTVSVFEKCNTYSKSVSELRKGSSEPDILSVSSIDSVGTSKTIDSKKKWKLGLKPPFRKGTFDCILRWRGKKAKEMEMETVTRKRYIGFISVFASSTMDILRVGAYRRAIFFYQYRRLHLLKDKAYINGQWVKAEDNAVFPVLDPANDKVIAEVPDMNVKDTETALNAASEAFKTWKNTTAKERSYIIRKWYNICQKNADHLAAIVTAEAGKPLSESKGEVEYGNSFLDWFADCARHISGEIISSPWPNKQILTIRQPIGIVSVITPWNFPYAMITRKVGALMAAGCTCVIKPSEDTPLSALACCALAEEAGIPKGIINVVTTSRKNAPAVGKVLCEDNSVAAISFTGSTFVGKLLYGMAAKGVKRVALELGGNAPFIVFPSADIDNALEQAMLAKFRNAGQACVGANRFLIHEEVFDKFLNGFKSLIQNKCILGPGTNKDVTCGPLINIEHAKKVAELVSDAVSKGAKVLYGGKFNNELGNKFYEPTLLIDVKPEMKIYSEEIFGPVAMCSKFKTEEEALKIANSTRSGLASYVFTRELGQAYRMFQQLDFGMIAINDGLLSAAEPPFGGIKESGIGKEGSMHGCEEFTDIKYILVSGLNK